MTVLHDATRRTLRRTLRKEIGYIQKQNPQIIPVTGIDSKTKRDLPNQQSEKPTEVILNTTY